MDDHPPPPADERRVRLADRPPGLGRVPHHSPPGRGPRTLAPGPGAARDAADRAGAPRAGLARTRARLPGVDTDRRPHAARRPGRGPRPAGGVATGRDAPPRSRHDPYSRRTVRRARSSRPGRPSPCRPGEPPRGCRSRPAPSPSRCSRPGGSRGSPACSPARSPRPTRSRSGRPLSSARLGLRRVPPVLLVPARIPPMLWPHRSGPRLLLPEGLLPDLHADELDTLLAHELAHVRRRDHWVRLVEIAATALFWWYPVTWWARRALRRAEERCCDEWVLRLLPRSAEAYANGLLKSLTFVAGTPGALPSLASGVGPVEDIEARLKEILMTRPVPRLAAPIRLTLAAAAALGLAVFPTHAQSSATKEEPAAPAAATPTAAAAPPPPSLPSHGRRCRRGPGLTPHPAVAPLPALAPLAAVTPRPALAPVAAPDPTPQAQPAPAPEPAIAGRTRTSDPARRALEDQRRAIEDQRRQLQQQEHRAAEKAARSGGAGGAGRAARRGRPASGRRTRGRGRPRREAARS